MGIVEGQKEIFQMVMASKAVLHLAYVRGILRSRQTANKRREAIMRHTSVWREMFLFDEGFIKWTMQTDTSRYAAPFDEPTIAAVRRALAKLDARNMRIFGSGRQHLKASTH